MIEITCTCNVCKTNAQALGKDILGARVPDTLADLTKQAKVRHNLVYLANDPNAVTGAPARAITGITAL